MGGTSGSIEQINRLTPEQQQIFSKLLGDFDPSALTEMFQTSVADPARQQFQEQTLPGIQERFIGGGGARSGAVGRAGVQAGANLESGLAGQLSQILAQAQESQLGRQTGLATANISDMYEPKDSNWMSLLGPIAGGLASSTPVGAAAARS